jgi:hypothetical protein
VVTGIKKEEEFRIKKEESIEFDLHQDKDEYTGKPPDVVKEEEDVTEDGEGIIQLGREELKDRKKPPAAVKNEEGYETEEKEDGEGDIQLDRDPEDCKKPPAAIKEEEKDEFELNEDGKGDHQLDIDEPEDCKKPPAAVREEER